MHLFSPGLRAAGGGNALRSGAEVGPEGAAAGGCRLARHPPRSGAMSLFLKGRDGQCIFGTCLQHGLRNDPMLAAF